MQITAKIVGLDKLERTFRALPLATQNKASKAALREGAKVIRADAQQNIAAITAGSKQSTGVGQKGIAVYNFKKKRGMLRVGVMVRKGLVNKKKIINGVPVRVGLYLSVLEYGKRNQPPRSWLRKAAKNKASLAYSTVERVLGQKMDDAVEAAKR